MLSRGLGLLTIAGEAVTPRLIRLADRPEPERPAARVEPCTSWAS